jgi:hypothetical protein
MWISERERKRGTRARGVREKGERIRGKSWSWHMQAAIRWCKKSAEKGKLLCRVDDVLAILLALAASPDETEILLLSVTFGNVEVEKSV